MAQNAPFMLRFYQLFNDDRFILRAWTRDDIEQIDTLNQSHLLHDWQLDDISSCFQAGYYGVVISDEFDPFCSQIVAYGVILIQTDECQLLNILVDEKYRRSGLASRLLNNMLMMSRQRGCDAMYLEVRVSNVAAIALYNKVGFIQVRVRKNYYRSDTGHEDALILSLRL
jgi:[ribosomal protein S18]-alanine N-acetyltransferase